MTGFDGYYEDKIFKVVYIQPQKQPMKVYVNVPVHGVNISWQIKL